VKELACQELGRPTPSRPRARVLPFCSQSVQLKVASQDRVRKGAKFQRPLARRTAEGLDLKAEREGTQTHVRSVAGVAGDCSSNEWTSGCCDALRLIELRS